MTRNDTAFQFPPAGLRRVAAARYCGVSPNHFDRMVEEGNLPAARRLGGVKIWLRAELDDALFALEGPDHEEENSCDRAFG